MGHNRGVIYVCPAAGVIYNFQDRFTLLNNLPFHSSVCLAAIDEHNVVLINLFRVRREFNALTKRSMSEELKFWNDQILEHMSLETHFRDFSQLSVNSLHWFGNVHRMGDLSKFEETSAEDGSIDRNKIVVN